MTKSAPAHSHSKYLSLAQLTSNFSSVDEADRWFVNRRWPKGVRCVRCDSDNVQVRPTRKPQPYRCCDCRKDFSVKTDTVLHNSKIPLPSWAIAFYLFSANLKSVSSMKLRRDPGITQKSAWDMGHRTREAWGTDVNKFDGPVEVDEAYTGGKEGIKHECKKQNAGRSPVGKAAVVGIKDRETNRTAVMPVESTDTATLQGCVHERTNRDTMVFVDEARAYDGLLHPHERVSTASRSS